ncbi:calcium-binding protein [Marinivivus vitaminiproducens]|uniref:calcium-binding protein n=1 Tax=Marinivivus vitaminiproducens TaxID=3035935 RepID=UPI00279D2C61|nr:hypothetical protein P4R82_20140 [Geminicoccaceae bacterium SCSIO 64248]
MEFTTTGTFGRTSTITHPDTGEIVSLAGKAGSGAILEATDDTLLTGDSNASNPDDAIIYDLTLGGENALRFTGFTSFDLGEGDDVLDLSVRPANAEHAYDLAVFAVGGEGDDVLWSGTGSDTLAGDVEVIGDGDVGGDDWIDGGAGGDLVLGDADTIEAGGRGGQDRVDGGVGDDILVGDANFVRGAGGGDTMTGGAGDDALVGDGLEVEGVGGDDTLEGGEGADTLFGDGSILGVDAKGGNDVLDGGAGDDILVGDGGVFDEETNAEGGDDVFVFGPGGGQDIILDFGFGNDTLDVSAWDFAAFEDVTIDGNGTEAVQVVFDDEASVIVTNAEATPITLSADDFLFA